MARFQGTILLNQPEHELLTIRVKETFYKLRYADCKFPQGHSCFASPGDPIRFTVSRNMFGREVCTDARLVKTEFAIPVRERSEVIEWCRDSTGNRGLLRRACGCIIKSYASVGGQHAPSLGELYEHTVVFRNGEFVTSETKALKYRGNDYAVEWKQWAPEQDDEAALVAGSK